MRKLNFIAVIITLLITSNTTIFTQTANLQWVNQLSGGGPDYVYGLNTDAVGNIYVTGSFGGTMDADPGPGTTNITSGGGSDIFVIKYNSSGDLVWAKQMGGSSADFGSSIAADASGNVFITGYFQGTADFDPGAGVSNYTSLGQYDIFVVKLDASGNHVWSVSFGGTGFDFGRKIAVDASGNSYITGSFRSVVDFDPGPGTNNVTSIGLEDTYIEKLDPNGNLLWNARVGGVGSDAGNGITLDGAGSVYITGGFSGTADMHPGLATNNLISNGVLDAFILRLDIGGNFISARGFGGTGNDLGSSLAIDPLGNILATGYFNGTVDFDPGAGVSNMTTASSSDEAYILKLNSTSNYVWSKQISSTSSSRGHDISVNSLSNIYITGRYIGMADLDPGSGTYNSNTTPLSFGNAFNLILDPLGNFIWGQDLGDSTNPDEGLQIKALNNGSFLSTGFFNGTADFDPTSSIVSLTSIGEDGFLQKICFSTADSIVTNVCNSYLSPSGNYTWTTSGNYTDTISNFAGCDSIIHINLTVLNSTHSFSQNACRSFVSPSTNYTWTSSGVYQDTIANHIGCDSIITVNLTITNIDTNMVLNNGVFTVGQTSAIYQWFDCVTATAIPGETSQSFTPTVNGSYGVFISYNGCTDTTSCYFIGNVGIDNQQDNVLEIFPNPSTDIINITNIREINSISILDALGRVIKTVNGLHSTNISVDISTLLTGTYIIEVTIGNEKVKQKFIKSN